MVREGGSILVKGYDCAQCSVAVVGHSHRYRSARIGVVGNAGHLAAFGQSIDILARFSIGDVTKRHAAAPGFGVGDAGHFGHRHAFGCAQREGVLAGDIRAGQAFFDRQDLIKGNTCSCGIHAVAVLKRRILFAVCHSRFERTFAIVRYRYSYRYNTGVIDNAAKVSIDFPDFIRVNARSGILLSIKGDASVFIIHLEADNLVECFRGFVLINQLEAELAIFQISSTQCLGCFDYSFRIVIGILVLNRQGSRTRLLRLGISSIRYAVNIQLLGSFITLYLNEGVIFSRIVGNTINPAFISFGIIRIGFRFLIGSFRFTLFRSNHRNFFLNNIVIDTGLSKDNITELSKLAVGQGCRCCRSCFISRHRSALFRCSQREVELILLSPFTAGQLFAYFEVFLNNRVDVRNSQSVCFISTVGDLCNQFLIFARLNLDKNIVFGCVVIQTGLISGNFLKSILICSGTCISDLFKYSRYIFAIDCHLRRVKWHGSIIDRFQYKRKGFIRLPFTAGQLFGHLNLSGSGNIQVFKTDKVIRILRDNARVCI